MLHLADSEQAFHNGGIMHKLESKAFEQNDNDPESINAGDGIMKETQKRVLCQSEGYGDDGNRSPHSTNDADSRTTTKLDCSLSVDSLTCSDVKSSRGFEEPITSTQSSANVRAVERDSVFYMDKSVMERELPELIVCHQDNSYQVVKDICIDEGVPSHNKFLFDMDVHEKGVCTVLSPESDISVERVKEKVDPDVTVPEVLKSLPRKETLDPDALNYSNENDCKTNFSLEYGLEDVQTTRKVTDYVIKKTPNEELKDVPDVLKSLPEKEKLIQDSSNNSNEGDSRNDLTLDGGLKDVTETMEVTHYATQKTANEELKKVFPLGDLLPNSSVNSMDEVELTSLQRPSETAILASCSVGGDFENGGENMLTRPTLVAAAKEHHKEVAGTPSLDSSDNEEAVSANHSLISTPEESDSNHAKSATHLSDSVSEELANHTMKIADPSSSGTKESPQNADPDHLGTKNLSRHGDPDDESSSSRLHYIPGETSFSASGPLSGLISYLGPIAYSGSLSLRSDSSTTSARSFAFPVLQSEWNSSPVRMAKADRRHRGWRHRLLCCRF